MNFFEICTNYWPELRKTARDLLPTRTLRINVPRQFDGIDLDQSLADPLIPKLRKVFPAATVADEVLAAAGLLAWLNPVKTAPFADTIQAIEQVPRGDFDDPRPWQSLTQRMLAFACGWGRSVGEWPWEGVWSQALVEVSVATCPHVEHVMKKLSRNGPGLEAAMRPRLFCFFEKGFWRETPDYFDELFRITLAAAQRFLTPRCHACPCPKGGGT